jgi:hypothetical protein
MGDQDTTQLDPNQQDSGTPPTQPGTAPDSGGNNDPAWLPDRLRRAEESAITKFLKSLGAETPDQLKASLDKLSTLETQNQTALEQAQAALTSEQAKREALEAQLADERQQRRTAAITTVITSAANAARAKHAEDVVMWAQSSGHTLDDLVDDQGAPVADQIKVLIDDAKKARPDWFRGDGPGSPSNSDGHPPEPDAQQRKVAAARLHQIARGGL